MSRASVILRNVAANWVGFAVNGAVTLVLTPFVLAHLGSARYGIWILSASVVGYYGLLDLGLRAGVTQYLTRYLAIGDLAKAGECMSAAVAALATIGLMMVGLSIGAAYAVPHLFDLAPELARETFWCILIVGSSTGIQFALQPYGSIFTARQRFDLANLIGITTRLLTAAAVYVVLKAGYGLIGISAATCAVSCIDYLIRWRVATRLVPELSIDPRRFNMQRLKEVSSFGLWNFLISINQYVYQHVPNMLIGFFMPVAAVGHYALAIGLVRQLNAVIGPIGAVMYPAAAAMDVQADRGGLTRLYHDGSRLMLLIMTPMVLIAAFWAEDFYRLWIGESYLRDGPFHSVALVFQILLISTVTNFSNIGSQILLGAGHVRLVATALLCGSALNLSASLILIGRYGLAGVAAATVLASAVIDLMAMPILVQRVMGLPVKDFLHRALLRPAGAALLLLLAILAIRLLGEPKDWFNLALQCLLAGAAAAAVIANLGVTAAERQRFVGNPLRRLLQRA